MDAISRALLVSIRFHDGRYHGVDAAGRPEWPPSPARVMQALVAAAARGVEIAAEDRGALEWLERCPPPVIAAPPVRPGQPFSHFMPNNDLDSVGGDPRRIPEIRTATKRFHPRIFDSKQTLLYLWHCEDGIEHAERVCEIANGLYQLGRGVDMGWAVGEILESEAAEARLAASRGVIYRPGNATSGLMLACPSPGSLASLIRRHREAGARFKPLMAPAPTSKDPGKMKLAGETFSQPPKPRFHQVAYDSPPQRRLFEIHRSAPECGLHAWPLSEVVRLVETVRDGASKRLTDELPEKGDLIKRVFGLCRDATDADKAQRIRILALPSIGHRHVERTIRRLLVEIPPNCPLDQRDIAWAFSAWTPHDPDTGEPYAWQLVEIGPDTGDRYAAMLGHYGMGGQRDRSSRLWRTVTPAALPQSAARRRIEPSRRNDPDERKGGPERLCEETRAAAAVCNAVRHAGIAAQPDAIRVQREPFEAKGGRAETFAPNTRFAKERLWHVEVRFAEPVKGPLIIGDGRYVGLGLMAPVPETWRDAFVFDLPGDTSVGIAESAAFLRAIRRALMALSRDDKEVVPRLFSGHEPDGAAARSGKHEHVFLAADDSDGDQRIDRLIIAAPWICDRSSPRPRRSDRELFERVVSSLTVVRAGRLGVIALRNGGSLALPDPLFGPARIWESRTAYRPTRHPGRNKDPLIAIANDLINECHRRGFPTPRVDVMQMASGPNGGHPAARLRLDFAVGVQGPIMLGQDAHQGGGLFAATS